ncbi:FG-GAP-like repeat-containing protein [Candidatus Poribacteria bacterium]
MRKLILTVPVILCFMISSLLASPASATAWIEETFEDFADGRFDGGGNIHASYDGKLKLTGQQWDLNNDGYLDIIFSNARNAPDASSTHINSFIYWGSGSGYLSGNRTELPTHYAIVSSIADLNNDGYLDVIFSNHHHSQSFIYWGSASGDYSDGNKTGLPTRSAVGNSVADLDNDGYLDIVFSNAYDGATYNTNSFIYWGSPVGFSTANRTELPTHYADGNSIADLDSDGHLDIIFSNTYDGVNWDPDSVIYWGAAGGFSTSAKTELPTQGAIDNSVADLDGDGFLDIVFSNSRYGTGFDISPSSFIYWGSDSGFTGSNKTELPTSFAFGNSIADLDADSHLDIVFSNHRDDVSFDIDSVIYWGFAGAFSSGSITELPTYGATGNAIVDMDDDGYLDIIFDNHQDGSPGDTSVNINSFIYRGSSSGFSSINKVELPTHGAQLSTVKDLGDVYTRQPEFIYVSSAYDTGNGTPLEAISWIAETPPGSYVQLQIRTATTEAALDSAQWYGPTGTSDRYTISGTHANLVHSGDQWIQYRVSLGTNYINVPALDKVEILFQNNVSPEVGTIIAPPEPVAVDTGINVSAGFTDQNTADTHTAVWNWGDGKTSAGAVVEADGSGSVTGEHIYSTAGVYTIELTVTDNHDASDESISEYVVIYDSEGGFVTGGGWINSPEGAYREDPSLTGKANFGFVSKYKKGAAVPIGQTEFQFKVADLNFHSDSYEWLVVAGHKAQYKGIGTINGGGSYGFMLFAIDEILTPSTDVDLFRIKIWDKDSSDAVVYDNLVDENAPDNADPTTAIGGGNIRIHTAKTAPPHSAFVSHGAALPEAPRQYRLLANFPNPFNPETWLPYELATDRNVTIRVYNTGGQLVRLLDLGHKPAGFYTTKSKAAYWDGRNEAGEQVSSGIYFYSIRAGEFTATKKMIVAR